MTKRSVCVLAFASLGLTGCPDGGEGDGTDPSTSGIPTTLGSGSTGSATMSTEGSASTVADTTALPDGTSSDDGPDPCLFCDAPNQQCIDDQCVTTCQGQVPDPCGPTEVCDVMSGECRDPEAACTLTGGYEACDGQQCGPGTVCDGQGECIPVAPCGDVVCLPGGECWGTYCSCERTIDCAPPSELDLNGPFAVEIGDLEFADDCTAWMVTLRSGTDYVRRLLPDGTLTEWPGVSNLNMGEVKVLKAVTPPAGITPGRPGGLSAGSTLPSRSRPGMPGGLFDAGARGVEGLGEVAITYTCCASCGCFTDPPQGVARLVEDDPANPLPLVIEAVVTQGSGPFGSAGADAGPFGLTWGIDRVLYVGNSTANGDIVTADLDSGTQNALGTLTARITAGAPISAAHLLFAIEGGEVHRFNVLTLQSELLVDLAQDVTSLSHDAFDGRVYVGLRSLEVVVLDPRTGTVEPFDVMPGRGRVTVSPNGQLWFSPVAYLDPNAIFAWDLPDAF
ncbi:hypothetical protein [Paraliomyxa miuraensis]|uniref:hypothetical protein n=1 Tax=Paraliomyxa miuraensis TaxID=376150 RepID=UPI0022572CB9|nr:hypothetical protein [Paraliomyxa miuraensis]MCX4239591.1 hypothetical protein [Paraliomyxa miuraensis]